MELTQLSQVREIAKCQNITHAAERLYVSQPALSKAVKNLENELGVKLFDREKNRITLNPAGEIALKYIDTALNAIEGMKTELLEYAGKNIKQLRFFAQSSSSTRHFIPLFAQDNPEIITEALVTDKEDMLEVLLKGKADIAFSFTPRKHPNVYYLPLCEERIAISVPNSSSLAKKHSVSVAELDGMNFLLFEYPDDSMSFIDNLFKKFHVNIKRHYEKDYILYNSLVKTTPYLTVSSTLSVKHIDYGNRKLLPLEEKEFTVTHYIHYLKNNAANVQIFIEWVKNNYKKIM